MDLALLLRLYLLGPTLSGAGVDYGVNGFPGPPPEIRAAMNLLCMSFSNTQVQIIPT